MGCSCRSPFLKYSLLTEGQIWLHVGQLQILVPRSTARSVVLFADLSRIWNSARGELQRGSVLGTPKYSRMVMVQTMKLSDAY